MKTKSFLRREEYKHLARLSIDGNILDVGGSKKSGYHELIGGTHTITTGNIDASYGTDLIFNAEERWPADDNSFDGVLFVNVLEHLYRYDVALDEARRVLKRGGVAAGVVPFMFNVHGSPNDYFRFTKSALTRMFGDRGFTDITIEELGTGAWSVVYHALGCSRWRFFAPALMTFARGLDQLFGKLKPCNLMSARYMPLGYYFEGRK